MKYIQPKTYSSQEEEFNELKIYLLRKYELTGRESYKELRSIMLESDFNKYQLTIQRMYQVFEWSLMNTRREVL